MSKLSRWAFWDGSLTTSLEECREDMIIPELGFSENVFGKFCYKNAWICDKSG